MSARQELLAILVAPGLPVAEEPDTYVEGEARGISVAAARVGQAGLFENSAGES